jgi:ATP-dependent RNA helicase DDX41
MSSDSYPAKRRRLHHQLSLSSPSYNLEYDDNYDPYIPVAQRRQAKLDRLSKRGATLEGDIARLQQENDEKEDEELEQERLKEKARKERTLLTEAQEVHSRKAAEGVTIRSSFSWIVWWPVDAKKTEAEKAEEADAQILAAIASRKKLASDMELAKGIQYTQALRAS